MTRSQAAFLETLTDFAGDSLRDVWVFDETEMCCLHIREDVAEALEGHDPARYIDNERYGFITRRTYEGLTYARQEYTVRGFTEFTQFRSFLPDESNELEGVFGVLASFDPATYDFQALYDALAEDVEEGYSFASLAAAEDAYAYADD